jgi:hypothetical protein
MRRGLAQAASTTTGAKRHVIPPMRDVTARARQAAIGRIEAEHRRGCDYLRGHDGEHVNSVLTAADYNCSLPPVQAYQTSAGSSPCAPHSDASTWSNGAPQRFYTDDSITLRGTCRVCLLYFLCQIRTIK